jgi:hypothetical protein
LDNQRGIKNLMKKKQRLKNITKLFILSLFTTLLIPTSKVSFAATPSIFIETEKETISVGEEIAVSYKINPAEENISSVALVFTYNSDILEFQDSDINQPGVQISQSSSIFGTVTKKIVSPEAGEISFSGSTFDGLSNEATIFKAIFKVKAAGSTKLNIDTNISKVLNSQGLVNFEFTAKEFIITNSEDNNSDENNEEENNTNNTSTVPETTSIVLNIGHISPETTEPNTDVSMNLDVSPTDKVSESRLYYKNSIDSTWTPTQMQLSSNGFIGTIPKDKVILGDLEYFFGVIDIDNNPHRYPVDNDQFYKLNVSLNTTEAISTPTSNIANIENPILTNPQDFQANIGGLTTTKNSQTTATGPEHIAIAVITLLGVVAFAFISERRKKTIN